MAKTRAQRKAERRKREARQAAQSARARTSESRAQHDTQVPESADVLEAELAEQGADLDALREQGADLDARHAQGVEDALREQGESEPSAPAPSRADVGRPEEPSSIPDLPARGREADQEGGGDDRITRRVRKRAEREERQRAKQSEERRRPREEPVERQRGRVWGFIVSCWAELKRVQWPDRETLIQASAVTLIFIAVAAVYLGVLDAIFSELVQLVL